MTVLTFRPHRLLVALFTASTCLLSACGGSPVPDESATVTKSPAAKESPTESSPVESTPAPGEWRLEDLKVGVTVPKEDLARLFPKWPIPQPPATLTEFSEQGAKDAAVYFDRLVDTAYFNHDQGLINQLDGGNCANCTDIRSWISTDEAFFAYVGVPSVADFSSRLIPDAANAREISFNIEYPISVHLDQATMAIKQLMHKYRKTIFTYVQFLDGRWTPVRLKRMESEL